MARASGPAIDALIPAEFTHKESGVHYRIYSEKGMAWLSFDRPRDPDVQGKRELLYYIGSGRRGRSYLFETDGFLFESPVNWYANKKIWDMAPAYQSALEIPLNLPAYPSCLNCHVSDMQAPAKDTDNRYPHPPFLHTGVSCERCHGPGVAHATGGGIVNPAKLSPARRDEVCMQCHL
ncbi:MAG: multiheme c-type cytochrome, partial [Candidatus Sulfotelmatobacter sp.]